ncbi:MAG: hypothetical protein CMF39_02025 [Legionellaceae bacterium]|nr:hypothetical protein [Legionellaceae bacterium]
MLPELVNVGRGSSGRILHSMRNGLRHQVRRYAANGNGGEQLSEVAESVHVASRVSNVEQDVRHLQRNTDGKFEQMQASIDRRFEQVDRRFEQVDRRFEHLEGVVKNSVEGLRQEMRADAREARTTSRWLIGLGVGVALGVARLSLFPPQSQQIGNIDRPTERPGVSH